MKKVGIFMSKIALMANRHVLNFNDILCFDGISNKEAIIF